MFTCSKERMQDKISTFSTFGDAGHGGITRYSLSSEALQARAEFVKRMTAIGAEIKTDDVANVYATLKGSDPTLPAIVMASHCDSVKNGGNYDGINGITFFPQEPSYLLTIPIYWKIKLYRLQRLL